MILGRSSKNGRMFGLRCLNLGLELSLVCIWVGLMRIFQGMIYVQNVKWFGIPLREELPLSRMNSLGLSKLFIQLFFGMIIWIFIRLFFLPRPLAYPFSDILKICVVNQNSIQDFCTLRIFLDILLEGFQYLSQRYFIKSLSFSLIYY